MPINKALIAIIICSLITFFYRAFPFIFFSKIKIPNWMDSLKEKLPPAFMIILVVYCLRGCLTASINLNICTLIAVVITGLVHIFKRNTILSIFIGTATYMILLSI